MESGIDFTELNDFLEDGKITATKFNNLIYDILVDMGEIIVAKAKDRTPVDTGALKASWGLRTEKIRGFWTTLRSRKTGKMVSKKLYIRTGHVTRKGYEHGYVHRETMGVVISNPQDYATQIENGFVKDNGDWYEGRHMLKNSLDEIKPQLPGYYEIYFANFKKENGLE